MIFPDQYIYLRICEEEIYGQFDFDKQLMNIQIQVSHDELWYNHVFNFKLSTKK